MDAIHVQVGRKWRGWTDYDGENARRFISSGCKIPSYINPWPYDGKLDVPKSTGPGVQSVPYKSFETWLVPLFRVDERLYGFDCV